MAVVQFWAVDDDGRMFLYREIVHTQLMISELADKVIRVVKIQDPDPKAEEGDLVWAEPKPKAVICDHDAEGRAQFRKHLGVSTTSAKKEVKLGIEAVMERLNNAGDGKPRLFVLADAVAERDPSMEERKAPIGLAEEVLSYVWAPSPDGRPVKEEPVKLNDHSCDAARYAVMRIDRGPVTVRHFGA